MRKTNLILGLVLFALIWATPSVYGQGRTGSIAGTVADSTGAVLPGAEITVTNVVRSLSCFPHLILDTLIGFKICYFS